MLRNAYRNRFGKAMKQLITILKIIKEYGIGWVLFRGYYELKRRLGILKLQFKPRKIHDDFLFSALIDKGIKDKKEFIEYWRQHKGKFIFDAMDIPAIGKFLNQWLTEEEKTRIISIANRAIKGEILCFSKWFGNYGSPPDWFLNPMTGKRAPNNLHWTSIDELALECGDVKMVWEASRFPQVYYYIRAYALTGDEKYPDAFWQQVESWIAQNPPELGINWKDGQEVSLRIITWIFALYAFHTSPASSAERIFNLIKYILYSAIRVKKNFSFALWGLRNNHAVSEATAIFLFGLLFPFFNCSKKFFRIGLSQLEKLGKQQIQEDGSYIQHSFNYHRLVLHLYSLSLRCAELNSISFSSRLLELLKKAIYFLYNHQDAVTGFVPNYGPNDGALLLPLTTCDYRDYRPCLQALHYILEGKRLYPPGKYDEELLWLCGLQALSSEILTLSRSSMAYRSGGYYVIRTNNNFAMIRCKSYKKFRPNQADMLHFDLWMEGENVLCDAGSFSYNTSPFDKYFVSTSAHNTVIINGKDQMKKLSRFMWLDWTRAKENFFITGNDIQYFEGEHYGYKGFVHRRAIINLENLWVIVDDIISKKNIQKEVEINQHWLISPIFDNYFQKGGLLVFEAKNRELVFLVKSTFEVRINLQKGNADIPDGWVSFYYGEKLPTYSLNLSGKTKERDARIITIISNDRERMGKALVDYYFLKTPGGYSLNLSEIGSSPILKLER